MSDKRLVYSLNQRLCPFRNVIGILLEKMTIGGAEKKARPLVVYGIVVNVGTVDESDGLVGIDERLVVVLPEPLGPATTQSVGLLPVIVLPYFSTHQFPLLQPEAYDVSLPLP